MARKRSTYRPKPRKQVVFKGPTAPRLYQAYFFRGADPAIAEVKQFARGRTNGSIEKDGGPTATTLANWFKGKTRRPQNATLEAAGRALGMKRIWVPHETGKKKGGDDEE